MEYLDVIYGKQKSFYSKAEVDYVYKKNGLSQDTLYSYCFRVCECLRDGSHPIQIKFFNFGYDVTATTVRHIKEFLKQAKFGCTPTTWTYSYADDFIKTDQRLKPRPLGRGYSRRGSAVFNPAFSAAQYIAE